MMNCGVGRLGRPSIGAWITYGLGSESENLPGYVVLSAGTGSSGGTSNWTNGFLPSTYRGVPFRSRGTPVLNLESPAGVSLHLFGMDHLWLSKRFGGFDIRLTNVGGEVVDKLLQTARS